MTKPGDGGSAFPGENTGYSYIPGMSLRDWFAGQVIAVLAAKANPLTVEQVRMKYAQESVRAAYEIADEALRFRLKDVEEE